MQTLYVVGEIKSTSQTEIQELEDLIGFSLPIDYKEFLKDYGLGEINELLLISSPDKEYFKKTFSNYMHFWNWKEDEAQKSLDGITIATTIDGDVILAIEDKSFPVILLPRYSDDTLNFPSFQDLISYYNKEYYLENNLFFDTDYNHQQKYFDLIKNGKFDRQLIESIQQDFLETTVFDRVFDIETQPKYIIQKIGGWVYFDNIGGSSIRVKYQQQFKDDANKIINSITAQIDRYGG